MPSSSPKFRKFRRLTQPPYKSNDEIGAPGKLREELVQHGPAFGKLCPYMVGPQPGRQKPDLYSAIYQINRRNYATYDVVDIH